MGEVIGVPALANGASFASGFAIEAFGAFFLVFIILAHECRASAESRASSAPLCLGLASASLQLFAFPFTGALFNPSRALSLMIVALSFNADSLVFLIAPFAGAF